MAQPPLEKRPRRPAGSQQEWPKHGDACSNEASPLFYEEVISRMDTVSNKRVLVVEDNASLSIVLRFNLQGGGFDVVTAANGREAWGLAQTDTFDLVISDEQMPEMSGLEFCRRFRDTKEGRHVPIVLLTAKQLELNERQVSGELGISKILGKPFSPRALVRLARELTERVCDGVPA
jgi:DNA-binding response OmpR family regulator